MTEGIVKQYVLSRTWDVLFDLISTYLPDPLTGEGARSSAAEWIKNGFPNPASLGSTWNFPLVIINLPDLEYETKVLDESKRSEVIHVEFNCHAITRALAQDIAEQILHIFESHRQDYFMKSTLHLVKLTGTSTDSDFIGAVKYYTKNMIFEFQRFD